MPTNVLVCRLIFKRCKNIGISHDVTVQLCNYMLIPLQMHVGFFFLVTAYVGFTEIYPL